MAEIQYRKRCPHAEKCPLFNGSETTSIPLYLHRNVFCNRGIKGWKNCKQYHLFESTASNSGQTENNQ